MTGKIGTLELTIHPVLPLYVGLMLAVGAGKICTIAFFCVALHELAHILAARCLGAIVTHLHIMPMGGVVHICGWYRLPARKAIAIALAGPAVSLLFAWAAVFFPGIFPAEFAVINFALCMFNLLPGLPMDGGRAVIALMQAKIGQKISISIAAGVGKFIGTLMLIFAISIVLRKTTLPLPLLLLAAYTIRGAEQEENASAYSEAAELARLLMLESIAQPLTMQMLNCESTIPPQKLLHTFRPDRCTLIHWQDTGKWERDIDWLQAQIHLDTGKDG